MQGTATDRPAAAAGLTDSSGNGESRLQGWAGLGRGHMTLTRLETGCIDDDDSDNATTMRMRTCARDTA